MTLPPPPPPSAPAPPPPPPPSGAPTPATAPSWAAAPPPALYAHGTLVVTQRERGIRVPLDVHGLDGSYLASVYERQRGAVESALGTGPRWRDVVVASGLLASLYREGITAKTTYVVDPANRPLLTINRGGPRLSPTLTIVLGTDALATVPLPTPTFDFTHVRRPDGSPVATITHRSFDAAAAHQGARDQYRLDFQVPLDPLPRLGVLALVLQIDDDIERTRHGHYRADLV